MIGRRRAAAGRKRLIGRGDLAGLQGVFELTAIDADRFQGAPADEGGTHVYGGHTFAQALLSALRRLEGDWACYAAHAQFLRVGTPAESIHHIAEATNTGRTFATQRVVSIQGDRPVMILTASFQRPADGADFQATTPSFPAPPDGFAPEGERFRRMVETLAGPGREVQLLPTGIDGRWTDPQDLDNPVVKPASRQIWLRSTDLVNDEPAAQQVALAYCSDFSLIETALRPLGVSWHRPADLIATSLEHHVWFHRASDFREWHLCSSICPTAHAGRAFVRGELHDRDGRLVASLAQEGLVRLP